MWSALTSSAYPSLDQYNGNDPAVKSIIVAYSTSILICVLGVVVCFRFLRRLDFSVNQAVAGALTLLFGTTFLHYTQNLMENNLILLLTLTGLCFQYEWVRTRSTRALLIGSLALGANLMVRLTTAFDILAVGAFSMVVLLWMDRNRGRGARRQAVDLYPNGLPFLRRRPAGGSPLPVSALRIGLEQLHGVVWTGAAHPGPNSAT